MLRNHDRGFTLIELMVVIVIIGILAALAIPKFTKASAKAKVAEAPSIIASYETAELAYLAETSSLGLSSVTTFDNSGAAASKWYTYADGAAGTYNATTKAPMGSVAVGEVLTTTVATTATVTHSSSGGNHFSSYLPNF